MTRIFLLTAPFDEEAKTGDGQYAASLEAGFKEHYSSIPCTWLKKEKGHYTIPFPRGTSSIPEGTIPSALVLQLVSNENTIISGYKLNDAIASADEAQNVNNKTVSPRTPKIIVNHDNSLRLLTLMDIFSAKPIELDKAKVDRIIDSLDEKKTILEKALENNQAKLNKLKKTKVKSEYLIKLYVENKNVQKHCSLNEYIEAHLEKKQFLDRLKKTKNNFIALQKHFTGPIKLEELEKLTEKFSGIKELTYDFHNNNLTYEEQEKSLKLHCGGMGLNEFIREFIQKLETMESIRSEVSAHYPHSLRILNKSKASRKEKKDFINLIFKDKYWDKAGYDIETFNDALLMTDVEERLLLLKDLSINEKLCRVYSKKKLSASEGFHLAYQANRHDPIKPQVIKDIIKSMAIVGDTHLDIHIRPPDCGAFITPEDIRTFQDAHVKVNITIHEYKQNYTRRYLQQYTHDLMRQADSVQFFNAMDRENAVIAATYGDCDKRNTNDPRGIAKKNSEVGANVDLDKYPIKKYGLQQKSGLTIASQKLSTVPGHALDIAAKPPNILSFGTIRPGKGFEEALKLAQLIKASKADIEKKIKRIPIVKIAGDPQDKELMQNLTVEQFGEEAVKSYQNEHPYNNDFLDEQRIDYWKNLVKELNSKVKAGEISLHNLYIDIHPWCTADELLALKHNCKYVCRMDDMGMRNNGSAIISVLDVGVIYTKFGTVTDDIFDKDGEYGKAVDIGKFRYGKYSLLKKEEEFIAKHGTSVPVPKWLKDNPDSSYKRMPESREPKEILDSIIAREENQLKCKEKIEESDNYKTIIEAQKLLKERFTLKNAAEHLLASVGLAALICKEEIDESFEIDPLKAQQNNLKNALGDIVPEHFKLSPISPIQGGFFGSYRNNNSGIMQEQENHEFSQTCNPIGN